MSEIHVQQFKEFLQKKLQQSPIIGSLERMARDGTSPAGKSREGVFTREFLCLAIKDFFYRQARQDLNLSDEEISAGLLIEGYATCSGFGFTPAASRKHLFTKSDVIKPHPPKAWFRAEEEQLAPYKACPDFAIRQPLLPLSIVGEVKYFASGSPDYAVRMLYDASRQATFYLGAFNGTYQSAMIVVADASRGHTFFKGLQLIRPELLGRFGTETGIHLVPISLI